jgi:tetratricopeptide (TPR) repeat protein
MISPFVNQHKRLPGTIAFLTIAVMTTGCGSQADRSESDDNAAELEVENTLSSCRTRLDAATQRLRPDSLSAIADLSSSVGALNAWLVECAADELRNMPISEANLAFLQSTAQRVASGPRFTARDATYIRDSLIVSQLAQSIVERSNKRRNDSEVARFVRMFRWVGNNIGLETTGESTGSKSFLDTLMTGRGTVRSRVWLLGVLLRQLQKDVVILLPGNADGDPAEDAEFLIAICLDDRILLFDAQSWMPIPTADDDSVEIDHPAGADYLTAHEAWNHPQIRIIAETPTVSPRMLVLQEQLPVESSAMLYEELAGGASEIRPLIERVVSAAPDVFAADRIALWGWPDQQATAAIAPDEEEQRNHDALMKFFEAPFEREPLNLGADFSDLLNQDGLTPAQRESLWNQRWEMERKKIRELREAGKLGKLFGRPSSRLLKTRLSQVEGSADRRIIQQLQKIRNASIDDAIRYTVPRTVERSGYKSIPFPEAIQTVNRQAAGSALYWIAICQLDRSQPGTAITSFESYRRQYPDDMWFYPSLMNQALAELAQGRRDAAMKTLIEADQESNPDQRHAATLLRRLQEAEVSAAGTETETETAVGPADPPQQQSDPTTE